ncbi:cytidine deaminase [Fulvivirga lutea]|uniref:Cytidine deaminase n=2 Tax=Fulvivirga lutea TaxID=2810512 RepID=A0A974WN07_9BACT|nr:cytidine deaminase [Fulvivirga lutea]
MTTSTDNFKVYRNFAELEGEFQILIKKAEEALKTSYSPYSGFTVGAALELTDGSFILGANQENASYPAGLCAERVALFQKGAVAPNQKIKALAVVAKRREEKNYRSAGPCGMCRQVMLEFEQAQAQDMKVLFKGDGETWILSHSSSALLPFSFGKDNL